LQKDYRKKDQEVKRRLKRDRREWAKVIAKKRKMLRSLGR